MSLSQSIASTRFSELSHSSIQLSGMLRQCKDWIGNEIDRKDDLLRRKSHYQRIVGMIARAPVAGRRSPVAGRRQRNGNKKVKSKQTTSRIQFSSPHHKRAFEGHLAFFF